jgi:hypothetical protein
MSMQVSNQVSSEESSSSRVISIQRYNDASSKKKTTKAWAFLEVVIMG